MLVDVEEIDWIELNGSATRKRDLHDEFMVRIVRSRAFWYVVTTPRAMNLSEPEILQTLMKWRVRVSAAAWLVVRDHHAAEDIFQNVALKAMTREVSFETESALLSWAFITARREGIDWVRRHLRETLGLGEEILAFLEGE